MKPDQRPQWQSVNIFISSTFEDMHAERDLINRRVIPRLREWCAPRRLVPIAVDYRWGITDKDAKENKLVIQKCLNAITDSQIFLYLAGQRRGWVPEAAQINDSTFAAYPRLRSAIGRYSMTEMEVLHATRNDFGSATWVKSPPCLFYRRSDSYSAQFTPEEYARFLDQCEEDLSPVACSEYLAACQQELKTWRDETLPRLLNSTSGQLHDYIAACARDHSGVFLTNFRVQEKALSDHIFDALTQYLVNLYPQHIPLEEDASPLEQEREHQAYHCFFNTLDKVKRLDVFSRLDKYVEGDQSGVCVLHAPAATGKTVLLATWLQTRDDVLSCFVGAGDSTATATGVLRYLLQLMQAAGAIEQPIPFDSLEIARLFSQALQTEQHKPLIILIDGIDRLDPDTPDWIPSWLGAGNKLIISYRTTDAASIDFLPIHYPRTFAVDLANFPFDAAQKEHLIDLYLRRYLKEFTPEQKTALVQLQGAISLLYLQLVLSVLCLSARFEDLLIEDNKSFEQKLQEKFAFGSTPQTAFISVIKRLEADFSSQLILLGFGLLAVSRQGLSICELRDLLSSRLSALDGPAIENRLLDCFWQIRDFITLHEGHYHFSYDLFGEAALEYVSQSVSLAWHAVLAEYFRTDWETASNRQLREYPYHCLAQRDSKSLVQLYTDTVYLKARCAVGFDKSRQLYNGVWELLLELERLTQAGDIPAGLMELARELQVFLAARYEFLRQYPRRIGQEIANYLPTGYALAAQLNKDARQSAEKDCLLLENEPPGRIANWVSSTVVRTLPAASICLTGGEEGSLSCWEIRKNHRAEQKWIINIHDSPILWLDTLDDRVLTTSRSSIYYWDLAHLRPRQVQGKLQPSAGFHFAAFLDARTLLACCDKTCLAVIDIFSGVIIWQGEIAGVSDAHYLNRRFDFSSAAKRLVFYDGQALRVFEWQSPQLVEIAALPTMPHPNHIAISKDGGLVLAADRRVVVELTHLESRKKQEFRRQAPLIRLCSCGDNSFCGYQFDGVLVQFAFDQAPHESYSDELLSFIDNGIVDMTTGLNADAVVCLQQPGAVAQYNLHSAVEEWRFSPPVLLSHGTLTAAKGRAAGVPALRPNSILFDLPQEHVALDHAVKAAAAEIKRLTSLNNGQIVAADQHTAIFLQDSLPADSYTMPGTISGLCAWQPDTAIVSAGSESFAINSARQWPVRNASQMVGGAIVQIAASGIASADRNEPACVIAANISGDVWVNGESARGFLGKLFASPTALSMDPACQWAAAGGANGRVMVWRLSNREEVFNEILHQGAVTGLIIDRQGARIYTASEDHYLCVLDIVTLQIVRATVLPWTPIAIRVYPDNSLSVLSNRGDVFSFDTGLEMPHTPEPSSKGLFSWFRRSK